MKVRHTKAWFINRIGKQVIKNKACDLFNDSILIASKGHAIALYLTQVEKGYQYIELEIA